VPFVNTGEATKSVEKPNRERLKSGRLVNTFTCTDHHPVDAIGLDKNTAMPLANLKTITDDVTLKLPHACIRDSLALYQNSLTHTAL